MCLASVIFVAIGIVAARSGAGGTVAPGAVILGGVATLMLASVGAVLVSRLPRNRIGWLLAIGGLVLAVSGATSGLADYGLNLHPGSVPGAIWFAWTSQWAWAPEIAILFILLPLVYPTGRLLSSRWRVAVAMAAVVLLVGGIGSALSPWDPDPYPVENPLALGGTAGDLIGWVVNIGVTIFVVAGGAAACASLVVRYRRATLIERAQLKWFAVVAMITGLGGTVSIVTDLTSAGAPTGVVGIVNEIAGFLIYGGLALLPVAIGVAVLRYRLYEIDRLISRTISWAAVTLILGGLFVALILALQALLVPVTGSNELAVAGSTLLVFALFQPLRRRVQRIVDRRFNRSRYDAEQTVAAFAARLRDEVDLEQLRAEPDHARRGHPGAGKRIPVAAGTGG
jgi:hypothetical protein